MSIKNGQILILDNYYRIIEIPKTKTRGFENLKTGDIVHIELDLKTERGEHGIYALRPRINGIASSSVSAINSLLNNGMKLEELDFNEIEEYIANGGI